VFIFYFYLFFSQLQEENACFLFWGKWRSCPVVLCENLWAICTQGRRLWIYIREYISLYYLSLIYIPAYPRKICGYGYGYEWEIFYSRQAWQNSSFPLKCRQNWIFRPEFCMFGRKVFEKEDLPTMCRQPEIYGGQFPPPLPPPHPSTTTPALVCSFSKRRAERPGVETSKGRSKGRPAHARRSIGLMLICYQVNWSWTVCALRGVGGRPAVTDRTQQQVT